MSLFVCFSCSLNVCHFQQEAKADTKKRGRTPAAKPKESTKSSDDEQAPVAKRGRGRPKGSKKKAAPPKAKVNISYLTSTVCTICTVNFVNFIHLLCSFLQGGSGEGRGRGRPRKEAPPKKDAASSEEEQEDDDDEEGSDQ